MCDVMLLGNSLIVLNKPQRAGNSCQSSWLFTVTQTSKELRTKIFQNKLSYITQSHSASKCVNLFVNRYSYLLQCHNQIFHDNYVNFLNILKIKKKTRLLVHQFVFLKECLSELPMLTSLFACVQQATYVCSQERQNVT